MNPRVRSKVIMLSAAGVVALLLVVFCPGRGGSRTVYRGKPLDYWFSQTFMTMVKTNGSSSMIVRIDRLGESYGCCLENPKEMKQVYMAIGTNCLPFLMRKLAVHDTAVSMAWLRVASALHLKRGFVPSGSMERAQAVTALVWLDPLPTEIMEKIKSLSKSGNPEVAASAKYVLENCHQAPRTTDSGKR